jgi:CcmD family protein
VTATKEIVMRALSLMLVLGVTVGVAAAQPAPAPAPAPPAPAAAAAEPDPGEMRKMCSKAMNADESFARAIIRTAIATQREAVNVVCADADIQKTHQEAVADVEENQRHVFAAYAAMWVLAAVFLYYLLRRQQRLKAELAQLRRDLEAAAGGKGEK